MKKEFLYAAIADAQGTIRSLDVRAGFIFVVLLLPVSIMDKIFPLLVSGFESNNYKYIIIGLSFLLWALGLLSLFRCIFAIDNPSNHITQPNCKGSFYSGDLFNPTKRHVFTNEGLTALRDVDAEIKNLPQASDEFERELVFEKMKLTYIRTVKLTRLNAAAHLTLLWMAYSALIMSYAGFKS